jgi:hypothetical protein
MVCSTLGPDPILGENAIGKSVRRSGNLLLPSSNFNVPAMGLSR